jgi:hypothetical protein
VVLQGRLKAKLDNVLRIIVRGTALASAAATGLLLIGGGLFVGIAHGFGVVTACLVFGAFFLLVSIIAVVAIVAARSRNRSRAGRLGEEFRRWRDGVIGEAALLRRKAQSGVTAAGRTAVATTRRLLTPIGAGLRGSIESRPLSAVALVFATGVLMGMAARHLAQTSDRLGDADASPRRRTVA